MNTYQQRQYEHDKIALPYLQERLREFKLSTIPHGIEIHDARLQKFLMATGRANPNALRDRYKPDIYIVPDDIKSSIKPILCEIKSENRDHNHFAIEFDSYCSGKLWDGGNKSVMYSFVRLKDREPVEIKCCWLNDVKMSFVNVPKRFDFEKNLDELTALYPNIEFKPIEYGSGSGTPFFIVRGDAAYLQPFDKFISSYLGHKLIVTNTRESLILSLSQCHLNPGWSVTRQTDLFNRYGIFTAESWSNLTTEQLKAMATEAGI